MSDSNLCTSSFLSDSTRLPLELWSFVAIKIDDWLNQKKQIRKRGHYRNFTVFVADREETEKVEFWRKFLVMYFIGPG